MEYILETQNLCKYYKKHKILNDLNIHVAKGSIYGLIGRNGAGKTTLIRIICGLQKPSKGTYCIYNTKNNEKKINSVRKRIGAIIETPSIYFDMTAEENLKEQYKVIGLPIENNLNELLNTVGLTNTGNKKVKEFSLGMKQRLGIAISLVGHPDLLILDEPINGLDPEGIIEIRELILKLNKENGITFLISSHYLDELSKVATHYGFINKGRIIKETTKKELEESCKKRIEIKVNNTTECVKYLEKNNISYSVIKDGIIDIYDNVNISELVISLSNRNCIISDLHEKDASLESYYINLIGGDGNV